MKLNCKTFLLNILVLSLAALSIFSCGSDNKLPILGERDWVKKTVDGKEVVDTIYNTIPPFHLSTRKVILFPKKL
jgi:protein SCO1/2